MAESNQKEESLFDFIYLDRERLASYAAQLMVNGTTTNTKITKGTSDQIAKKLDVNFGVLKGDLGGIEGIAETIEHSFDASWKSPLDLIKTLQELGFVAQLESDPSLGQVALLTGKLQILDLRLAQKLYGPVMDMTIAEMPDMTSSHKAKKKNAQNEYKNLVSLLEKLPHSLQMRVFGNETNAWATLSEKAMMIDASELLFKHGPFVQGEWACLGIVDALPYRDDVEDEPQQEKYPDRSQMELAMLQMSLQMRIQFGRPERDYGVTPLAIFRKVSKSNSSI